MIVTLTVVSLVTVITISSPTYFTSIGEIETFGVNLSTDTVAVPTAGSLLSSPKYTTTMLWSPAVMFSIV